MRHENKFKIGDRVRFVEPYAGLEAGAEGTVTGFWAAGVDVNVNGIDHGCFYSRVELTPTLTIEPGKHYRTRSGKPTGRVTVGDTGFEAVVDGHVRIFDKAGGAVHGDDDIVEAWVPKVGERVVEAAPKQYDFVAHWRDFWQGAEGPIVDDAFVVTKVSGNFVHYSNRVGGNGPQATLDCFEPLPVAPQPAALKIEAGRYYKTRDGQKVGPLMTTDNNEYWPFKWPEQTMYYKADGYSCPGAANRHRDQDDLVAEWQETTNVGAQVDTLAEEYGSASASNDNATKPKFNVGDRISGYAPALGDRTGVITTIDETDRNQSYRIRDEDSGFGMWLENYSVRLAPPTPKPTAIVALIENGQPKPAAVPHVHASEAAAITEAKRLAGVRKGKQFGVFVLTTTAEEAAPTYEHEWQRLAVAGRKIDAIRELRGLTGMSLKPAKDVVEHFTAYPYGQAA